jgi:hypothetical protein
MPDPRRIHVKVGGRIQEVDLPARPFIWGMADYYDRQRPWWKRRRWHWLRKLLRTVWHHGWGAVWFPVRWTVRLQHSDDGVTWGTLDHKRRVRAVPYRASMFVEPGALERSMIVKRTSDGIAIGTATKYARLHAKTGGEQDA